MTNALVIQNNFEKRLIYILAISILLSAGLYGFLVKQTIQNVVARKGLERSHSELSSKVANLEAQYISLTDSINLTLAHTLGFVETNNAVYAYKASRESLTLLSSSIRN
jgi:hypothetical protein